MSGPRDGRPSRGPVAPVSWCWVASLGSDLGPSIHPGREVLAGDVGPAVEALGDRGRPVPDVLPVRRVLGVEDVAVVGVDRERTRLRVARRLAEVLGDLDV